MSEATTEQLAEIQEQAESTPATGYTPPEGWRVLAVGEALREGDVIVHANDAMYATARAGGWVGANQRYIRPIEQEPEPQPKPVPVQVCEGRWRTRGGDIRNVTPTPAHDSRAKRWPWRDAAYDQTWTPNGKNQFNYEESQSDLVEYLGPIEQQPEPVPEPESDTELQAQVAFLKGREVTLATRLQQEREVTTRLRSEVSYVQNLLGTEKRRVTELEELASSLRTINETQEKAFNAAGKANTDLQHRLNVVAAEWAEQAETIRRLQIELDAAQQVPQAIADRFEEGWNQGTARAIETVLEWLEPIRLADSAYLANATMQHLPSIMRHLTGLAQD